MPHCPLYHPSEYPILSEFSKNSPTTRDYEESFAVRSRASQECSSAGKKEEGRPRSRGARERLQKRAGRWWGPDSSPRIGKNIECRPFRRALRTVRTVSDRFDRAPIVPLSYNVSHVIHRQKPANSSVKIRAATGSTVSCDKEGELRRAPARRLAIPP